MTPPKHLEEEARLASLHCYGILDTDYEQVFDDITRLAADLLHAPIAVINLIDRDRQWFKSEVGLGVRETPLDISICGHAILQPDVMVVPDLSDDERFLGNPLVTGAPHLRFYAGALLESSDGYPLGTLCVLDHSPREGLTELQKNTLRVLARQVMTQLELRLILEKQAAIITERQRTTEALRDAQERVRLAGEGANFGTWDFDLVTGQLFWDKRCRELHGYPSDLAIDYATFLSLVHPEDRAPTAAGVEAVLAPESAGQFVADFRVIGYEDGVERWLRSSGQAIFNEQHTLATRFIGIIQDITEIRRNEARERARLTEIFQRAPAFMATLRGPQHIFDMANPPYYQLIAHREIIGKPVAEALPEIVDQGFVALLDQVYQTGEPYTGRDIRILLQPYPNAPLEEHSLDFTYQPMFNEDGTVWGILAHGVDLTQRKRLEQERERLFNDTRSQAEREALLNQIGNAIRSSLDPEEMQSKAVALLGKAMGLDRCYFAVFDPVYPVIRVGQDWHRSDLPSMQGEYPLTSLRDIYQSLYTHGGNTIVFNDVLADMDTPAARAQMTSYNLRAFLGVSLLDSEGKLVALLRAAMSDAPRVWTPEEISLVESVATLVKNAVDAARIQQRERNIALILQEALIPILPPRLPGLFLSGRYQPALAESEVGGDFWDIFGLDAICHVLVVGDLSGKGLAAASQVATVRNMLRYAMYTSATIAEALTTLNNVLSDQSLLTGFATLFVAAFDPRDRTLTYTNCGQEPGLIWRKETGEIEMLPPTGPILGGWATERPYEQRVIQLQQGDVFTLFTDGLTEVGPTRKAFLEAEGVGDLLQRCCGNAAGNGPRTQEDADAIVTHLIQQVEEYRQGGMRDDIALLLAIVE